MTAASASTAESATADCEGRAAFNANSGSIDLPYVRHSSGGYRASLKPDFSSHLGWTVQSVEVAPAPSSPNQRVHCHAQLHTTAQNKLLRIHIPVIDVDGVPYRAQLSAQDGGRFTLLNASPVVLGKLEPLANPWFGINHDWGRESVASTSSKLGFTPDVFVYFSGFPQSAQERIWLDAAVVQLAAMGKKMVLTLEPHAGLSAVTPEAIEQMALQMKGYNGQGVSVFVRFAHEMNGSWYAWSQQPIQYVQTFRRLAEALHRLAPQSAMLWAPNYGGGYPFSGGRYQAAPGTPDYALLDTDQNGVIDSRDDPYAPYYPGDDAVDWVGMSLYHWGNTYPWGKNDIPEPDKFTSMLTGEYTGTIGDERSVPNFYQQYAQGRSKPLAIVETGALYVPSTGSPALELAMKKNWWEQIFAPELRLRFPQLKMINWFDWVKTESEIGGAVVDWSISQHPELIPLFRSAMQAGDVGVFDSPSSASTAGSK